MKSKQTTPNASAATTAQPQSGQPEFNETLGVSYVDADAARETTYDIEMTDTFGGEANYSWVRRHELTVAHGVSDLAIVRRAKALLGMSGVPCRRSDYGDSFELRPYGACVVIFITARY